VGEKTETRGDKAVTDVTTLLVTSQETLLLKSKSDPSHTHTAFTFSSQTID